MIGIYIYAHVNRYQIFTIPQDIIIKYDNWTDRTFLFYPKDNVWIEVSKQRMSLKK